MREIRKIGRNEWMGNRIENMFTFTNTWTKQGKSKITHNTDLEQ